MRPLNDSRSQSGAQGLAARINKRLGGARRHVPLPQEKDTRDAMRSGAPSVWLLLRTRPLLIGKDRLIEAAIVLAGKGQREIEYGSALNAC